MNSKQIWMGNTSLHHNDSEVKGGFTTINGEQFYRISNYDQMPDFFMTIVSDSDHWMFISSNGSLSAGRKDRDNALFPYYTDDKIHDYAGITGSKTTPIFCNGHVNPTYHEGGPSWGVGEVSPQLFTFDNKIKLNNHVKLSNKLN